MSDEYTEVIRFRSGEARQEIEMGIFHSGDFVLTHNTRYPMLAVLR